MGLRRLSFDNEGIATAVSFAQEADDVAQDLARQLISPYLGFVLFFCSAQYDLPALSHALELSFGGVPLVGCTTAGEISEDGYGRGCISAIGFDHRHFTGGGGGAALGALHGAGGAGARGPAGPGGHQFGGQCHSGHPCWRTHHGQLPAHRSARGHRGRRYR